jgi:hypothetical protein
MKKLFRYLILFTFLINTAGYGFFRMNNIKVPLRNFLSKSKKLFNVDNHRRDFIIGAGLGSFCTANAILLYNNLTNRRRWVEVPFEIPWRPVEDPFEVPYKG